MDKSPSMPDSNFISYISVDGDYCEIIVVRHGETQYNTDGKIQGQLDIELNEAGREQATMVADRLSREHKVSFVYSSDLKRALVTAEVIAARCGYVEVIKDKDFRERHMGELQGVQWRVAPEVCTKAYMGGGESFDQLYQRCTSALQRIARKHRGEQVVVVTHGAVIEALCKKACPTGSFAGNISKSSISVFHVSDEDKWIIKVWADISHLNPTAYLKSGVGGHQTAD